MTYDHWKTTEPESQADDGANPFRAMPAEIKRLRETNADLNRIMKATAAEVVDLRSLNAELLNALNVFMKQWNACGPNSDFGRYFQTTRDTAQAAIARAQEHSNG